jgi:multicomponent Na+:H+ antiporter subunit C
MIIVSALAIAAVFGAGAVLLLRRDLIQVAVGVFLTSAAAILTLMAVHLMRGSAPIHPLPPEGAVSDPLVQALALTALVINLGTSAFFLSLVYRVYTSHRSLDQDDLRRAEEKTHAREDEEEERLVQARKGGDS